MKILLSNKFYYPRGGDCVYTINLEKLLKQHGHEVAMFAMQHPENLPIVKKIKMRKPKLKHYAFDKEKHCFNRQ